MTSKHYECISCGHLFKVVSEEIPDNGVVWCPNCGLNYKIKDKKLSVREWCELNE
jgi:DNA-directed RNA polymerase subunit RPC12/RpoP